MPYAKLFRSRWAALLWAAGMLWFAVDVAGFSKPDVPANNSTEAAASTDVTGTPISNSDLAIFESVMNGN